MGQVKKFIEDIKETISEFLGETVDSYVFYRYDGVFCVSLECLPKDSICVEKISLLNINISIEGDKNLIINHIEFPILEEKTENIRLTLEDAKKFIVEKLGIRKLKFIFENLK